VSCSDPDARFQDFVLANYEPLHFHRTMNEQTAGFHCQLHSDADACDPKAGVRDGHVRLAVYGTPCPPFSNQRCKRTAAGSVKSHKDYNITFQDTILWMQEFEPGTAAMEQVQGFAEPESSLDNSTPLARLMLAASIAKLM
jgi:site-specific DNA-cytosine methylase